MADPFDQNASPSNQPRNVLLILALYDIRY